MVFSSLFFLIFFLPVFIIIYNLLPKKGNTKNIFILLASIFFYSWGGPKFIFAILFVTLVDFVLVNQMFKSETPSRKKLFFFLSLSLKIGLLLYFKYFNFFIDNFNVLFHLFGADTTITIAKVFLPIGISFYTFESITYTVDVYRGEKKPLKYFWEYQLYILMFPTLIAGPIIRYQTISDQIKNHTDNETLNNKLMGFIQFVIGLSKKVLIANALGTQADAIFALEPSQIDTTGAWIGAIAYTFQIYFDFSGYSDMAIGLGRIMGFKFTENFNNPYIATSITDFWRRWHITLSTWLRDYIFMPLSLSFRNSGNKGVFLSVLITFVLCGFWHGAAWNFVFWGFYQGVFLVLERVFLLKLKKRIGLYPNIIFTFLIVIVGWVFFRSENLQKAFQFVKKMFAFEFGHDKYLITNNDFDYMIVIAIFFSFWTLNKRAKALHDKFYYSELNNMQLFVFTSVSIVLYFLCSAFVSGSTFNPFIYFKF
jgi:alginate O-acetyltransferase complex protein AlgI